MKHLLVLAPNYTTFIKDQVEALASFWDRVTVLIRHNPGRSLLKTIDGRGNIGLLKENLVDHDDIPDNVNVKIYRLTKFTTDSVGASLGRSIAKKVIEIVRREGLKIDLIHSHFAWPMGYAGTIVSKELGVPNVITAHGYDIYDLPSRNDSMKKTVSEALNNADRVITVSHKNVEHIAQLDIEKPVIVIPNGYKEGLFRYLPEAQESIYDDWGISKDTRMLISVGNLEEIKGHMFLVEALSYVQDEYDDVSCYIIGGGPQRALLQKRIDSLQLDSICNLVGARPHQEIPLWMNSSDLIVLPSLNEGNPTVMFEAMACGKPLIGTRVGGIPEVINSQEYGLLCEPGSVEELASVIVKGLEKDWNAQAILEYARAFTWQQIAERIWKVQQELI
jgi:glycosyltransferase involved in cell wall biosynthesis